ncbi:peptide/nickel transport system ATP-binding protein [Rathayibacter oskolensis]|uniref:Peptide/nickel transport system ATP-binding protein n=1 Tax=Rathayibacter oskolensis TaxID=1891671 RepID=A0A1X7MUN8_9MICO|nr:ABC transporter ATP-binding protein [Rathayibacter oskolensis]SMH28061.1 peptide/nickel transport system ATP-binding protein [Rathayibacter oskolensis]
MSAPLLSLRDVTISFSTPTGEIDAVRGLDLELSAGETIAIVGESGSGKSTTAASINRLLPDNGRISSGSILFDGEDLAQATEKRMTALRGAGIGLVPQDPMSNLNPLQRIGTQIREALLVHGRLSAAAANDRVVELLEMVGIPEPARRARQYPHELSGGMRQRVLIAIGLACRPRLLIADEPTSALDVTVQRGILDQLERLTAEMGTAVILITHDLALAAERADRVLVLFRGEVVEQGEAERILRSPEHEYTQRLLAAAPNLTSKRLVTAEAAPASEEAPLVSLTEVGKQYPVRTGRIGRSSFTAVESSSFDIPRGRTIAVVGESGSGKSTTAKLVLRLEEPTSGTIEFRGRNVAHLRGGELTDFRRHVQPVFQNPYSSLDARYTVFRSIEEPLLLHRIGDRESRRKRVEELLSQVALPQDVASKLPRQLSGGQLQRVAIARALALSPELVVLDEAVSALDVLVQEQILELLAGLQRELGLSYLFISHDLAVVRMISHTVHVMQQGRIVESGTPEQIFDAPQHPYTRALLAAIPDPWAAPVP